MGGTAITPTTCGSPCICGSDLHLYHSMPASNGLLAVLSAKRLGAKRIILMGRHKARTDLGREFGATDVVAERGEEGVAKVRELTGGQGTHVVLEAVGHVPAYEQTFGSHRPVDQDGVPDGHRVMDSREALTVLVQP